MKQRWTTIAWSVIYLLLLLSLLTPLSIVTVFLLVVPVAILFTTLNVKSFLLHVIPVWLLAAIINPIYLIIAAYFLIPGLVMGYWYRKRAPAMDVLKVGLATILMELMLLLIIGTAFFQLNIDQYVEEIVKATTAPLVEMGVTSGQFTWTQEYTDILTEMTKRMVPFAMIISSFLMTVVTHALVRPTLNTMGISVPALKRARDWRLPRSLIWYYLIVVIMNFFVRGTDSEFLIMIVVNAIPVLQICFMIQAIGFFFYLAHQRKWHPIVPFLIAVPIVLFRPMMIIGIMDIAFPLRQALDKNKR